MMSAHLHVCLSISQLQLIFKKDKRRHLRFPREYLFNPLLIRSTWNDLLVWTNLPIKESINSQQGSHKL